MFGIERHRAGLAMDAVADSAVGLDPASDGLVRSVTRSELAERIAAMTKERPAACDQSDEFDWTGVRTRRTDYDSPAVIFAQGDRAASVLYLDTGTVRLSVQSDTGKEAVMAVVNDRQFFGEGCLAGQTHRMATATAMTASIVVAVEHEEMVSQLRTRPAFASAFLTHMLTRNIRIEEDLIDQLFSSTEKRLARTLLVLMRHGEPEASRRALPHVSQQLLAEMVGTTRSRVNFFMNKFRKLGFIEYNGPLTLKINDSLLSVVLRD
jgi:CRP/FNR family transcriptional regulator, cyclic AMP receptor protein